MQVSILRFQAHLCRMVSSNCAHKTGVALEEIQNLIGLMQELFLKIYLRNTKSDMSYTHNMLDLVLRPK